MTNEASTLLDSDAANKAADADKALQELGTDMVGAAYITATITVWDEDERAADAKLKAAEKIVQGRDFTAIPETLDAIEARLGSLPGHLYANARQPPVSTLNLVHMVPISAVRAGPARNDHLDSPPLLYTETEGATPFRFDGRPSLIIVDEGRLALDDQTFGSQLREWLKTLRKKNASVIFATQSLADIDGSNIAPAIVESCPTRIFLPNERAFEPQIAAIYHRFGLNDRQLEIVARATPKRDYYCQSRRGNRLFDPGSARSRSPSPPPRRNPTRRPLPRRSAEHGRAGFATAWLKRRGLGWAVGLLGDTIIPTIPAETKENT